MCTTVTLMIGKFWGHTSASPGVDSEMESILFYKATVMFLCNVIDDFISIDFISITIPCHLVLLACNFPKLGFETKF